MPVWPEGKSQTWTTIRVTGVRPPCAAPGHRPLSEAGCFRKVEKGALLSLPCPLPPHFSAVTPRLSLRSWGSFQLGLAAPHAEGPAPSLSPRGQLWSPAGAPPRSLRGVLPQAQLGSSDPCPQGTL